MDDKPILAEYVNPETADVYRNRLNAILDRSLNADTIESYGEDALNDLIGLIGDVSAHIDPSIDQNLSHREIEDQAFVDYGLGDIESILDHVDNIDKDIKSLKDVISSAELVEQVIVPPDATDTKIEPGQNEFGEKLIISRTKTVLFLLEHEFDIDVHDEERVKLTRGVVTKNMMRTTSYIMTEVPELDRIILTCDEQGNVTYVFDSNALKEKGITAEQIAGLTKSQLNEIIEDDQKSGQRIVYTNKFPVKIVETLHEITSNPSIRSATHEEGLKFLIKKAPPEGYLSIRGFAKKLEVGNKAVYSAVKQLDSNGSLTTPEIHIYGQRRGRSLSEIDQRKVKDYLAEKGRLSEKAPEGYLSITGFAKKLEVNDEAVYSAVKQLVSNGSLTTPEIHMYGPSPGRSLSEIDQRKVKDYLAEKGRLSEKAPEGYLSITGLAKKLEVGNESVYSAVRQLDSKGSLSPPEIHMYGTKPGRSLSESDQKIIIQYLNERRAKLGRKLLELQNDIIEDNGNA